MPTGGALKSGRAMRPLWKRRFALVASTALLNMMVLPAAMAQTAQTVTLQPFPTPDVVAFGQNNPTQDPVLSEIEMIKLLQQKIKYVFVIFQENRSFDHYFGTLPGANGLYADFTGTARSPASTPGFNQTYTNLLTNTTVTVQPFLMGPAQNATAITSVDHSHTGLAVKLDVVNGVPQMDKFASEQYSKYASAGGAANDAKGTQYARLVMSHVDCNTIPFMWQWATRFTIFDNIFATEDGPSTPNAIALIAGQSGESQWVKHPNIGTVAGSPFNGDGPSGGTITVGSATGTLIQAPTLGDTEPFYGSPVDATTGAKVTSCASDGCGTYSVPQTYASLPLTFLGNTIQTVLATNRNTSVDLADTQNDIPYIQGLNYSPIPWKWYQDGYGLESSDGNNSASHAGYVTHHNAPSYFGYIANTPSEQNNLASETQFFTDVASNALPSGGVFIVRGGYLNQQNLVPPVQNPSTSAAEAKTIQSTYVGDDDHASYSDSQLSEAFAARTINAIAGNPNLWEQSAIVITYDESDGFYDHVPPTILSYGPDGAPEARGIRIPLILISPYARTAAVSHALGDHNSVIETINTIFGTPALASLPDEAAALAAGNSAAFNKFGPTGFQQTHLGPRDINSPQTDSLLSGFDPKRLLGLSPPVPAGFAMIASAAVTSLPHASGAGCSAIGVTPMDARLGITNVIPSTATATGSTVFNPRPGEYPANN